MVPRNFPLGIEGTTRGLWGAAATVPQGETAAGGMEREVVTVAAVATVAVATVAVAVTAEKVDVIEGSEAPRLAGLCPPKRNFSAGNALTTERPASHRSKLPISAIGVESAQALFETRPTIHSRSPAERKSSASVNASLPGDSGNAQAYAKDRFPRSSA
jgi:hypothetical protein